MVQKKENETTKNIQSFESEVYQEKNEEVQQDEGQIFSDPDPIPSWLYGLLPSSMALNFIHSAYNLFCSKRPSPKSQESTPRMSEKDFVKMLQWSDEEKEYLIKKYGDKYPAYKQDCFESCNIQAQKLGYKRFNSHYDKNKTKLLMGKDDVPYENKAKKISLEDKIDAIKFAMSALTEENSSVILGVEVYDDNETDDKGMHIFGSGRNPEKKEDSKDFDGGIADHYVLLNGTGYDAEVGKFYFHENVVEKNKGTTHKRNQNRLYIDFKTGTVEGISAWGNRAFRVASVTKTTKK